MQGGAVGQKQEKGPQKSWKWVYKCGKEEGKHWQAVGTFLF